MYNLSFDGSERRTSEIIETGSQTIMILRQVRDHPESIFTQRIKCGCKIRLKPNKIRVSS